MERLGIESPKIGGGFSDDDEDGGGNEMLALQGLANEVRRTRMRARKIRQHSIIGDSVR